MWTQWVHGRLLSKIIVQCIICDIIGIWSEPFPDTTYYIPPNTWVFGFVFDLANSFGFFLHIVNIFVLLKDFSHNISLLTCTTNRIKTVRYYFRCYFPKHITVITNKNKHARKKIENVKNKLSVPTRLLLSNIIFSPLASNLGTLTPPLKSLRSQLALSAFEVHNSHAFYVICLKYKQIVRSPHTYTHTHKRTCNSEEKHAHT